jgi:hypothetical protein
MQRFQLKLEPGLIMLLQVKGSTTFKLEPLNQCEEICSEIEATLHEGEIREFYLSIWCLIY